MKVGNAPCKKSLQRRHGCGQCGNMYGDGRQKLRNILWHAQYSIFVLGRRRCRGPDCPWGDGSRTADERDATDTMKGRRVRYSDGKEGPEDM